MSEGSKGLTYEERLKALKLQPVEKKRHRNDSVQAHKILYNQIDREATQFVKFSRRLGLRRLSIRLLRKPGEPTEEETVLHAGLLITGAVRHSQSHRYQSRLYFKNY